VTTIIVCIGASLIVVYRTRNAWRLTLSNPQDHNTTKPQIMWEGGCSPPQTQIRGNYTQSRAITRRPNRLPQWPATSNHIFFRFYGLEWLRLRLIVKKHVLLCFGALRAQLTFASRLRVQARLKRILLAVIA